MKIYDADGAERDWEWAEEKYNLPDINEAPREYDHWEVVALHEVIGPASMTVRLVGVGTVDVPIFWQCKEQMSMGRLALAWVAVRITAQTGGKRGHIVCMWAHRLTAILLTASA